MIIIGTPAGVGYSQKPEPLYLKENDRVEIEIEGCGVLSNNVALE